MPHGSPETGTDLAQQSIRKDAAIWLARIDRGLRGEEVPALRSWLEPSQHRECILTTARLWHGPETTSVLAALFPVSPEPARRWPRRLLRADLFATTCAAVIVTVAALMFSGAFDAVRPVTFINLIHETDDGEIREVALADGSTVRLNADTRIVLNYRINGRDAQLSRGEARFAVAPDGDRPFTVRSGTWSFQSVQGAFNVRSEGPDEVTLVVTEGEVRVVRTAPAGTLAQADAALAWQPLVCCCRSCRFRARGKMP